MRRRKTKELQKKSQDLSKKKEKKQYNYRGLECDSFEEVSFLYWAFELLDKGYIESINRGQSYLLCGPMTNDYAKQLKTKCKPCSETLLQGHSYTPDFELIWSELGVKKFVWKYETWNNNKYNTTKMDKLFVGHYKFDSNIPNDLNKTLVTHIEIKPSFDQNNMTRAFKINQKWMWDKLKKFVNLVQPQALFETTFTPKDYLTTYTGKDRKLKWKPKTIEEFLNI